MDVRVPAAILVLSAKASDQVAKLERLQAETPNLRGNSDQRIRIGRRLKVARELAESWQTVLALVSAEQFAEAEEQKAEQSAPGRIVARSSPKGDLVCNRPLCKEGYGGISKGWTAVRADDTGALDHTQCDRCGKDVRA